MATPESLSREIAAKSRWTSSAGRLAVGSSRTMTSAFEARARLIATSDFSVRLSCSTLTSGSISAPSWASASTARRRAASKSTSPQRRG